MITKLLDLQSFSKVWKTAVRQKFSAIVSKIYNRVTLSADRLGDISCLLIRRISLQALRKNYIGYLKLRLKACNNVKSVIVLNASIRLASRSFKNTGPNNSLEFYDFQSPDRSKHPGRSQCFGDHHVLKTAIRTSLL